jgi:hypothetical protein
LLVVGLPTTSKNVRKISTGVAIETVSPDPVSDYSDGRLYTRAAIMVNKE